MADCSQAALSSNRLELMLLALIRERFSLRCYVWRVANTNANTPVSLCVVFFGLFEAKQVNGQQGLTLLMIEAKKRPLSLWRGTAGPTLAEAPPS